MGSSSGGRTSLELDVDRLNSCWGDEKALVELYGASDSSFGAIS